MIGQRVNNSTHTLHFLPHTFLNHLFAILYTCGLSTLFYHHSLTLLTTTTATATTTTSFLLLLSDIILAFMWATTQSFRIRPIKRRAYIDKLDRSNCPKLDVFICTADPYKEPPMGVVNTALSVMAYDYPTEKISVYVSDDGGSELTLFAFMEAGRFGRFWLPYCKENDIMERCPEAYFRSNHACNSSVKTLHMKDSCMMLDTMISFPDIGGTNVEV